MWVRCQQKLKNKLKVAKNAKLDQFRAEKVLSLILYYNRRKYKIRVHKIVHNCNNNNKFKIQNGRCNQFQFLRRCQTLSRLTTHYKMLFKKIRKRKSVEK